MNKFHKLLASICIPFAFFASPALAEGELTVEYSNGDVEVFSDVEISNTETVLYIKGQETGSILLITKNECDKEGELFVCQKARVGLQSYGVLEELKVEQIFLFINGTNEPQDILGSTITLSPNTVLLEFATDVDSFVSGFGTIDSTSRPEGALK